MATLAEINQGLQETNDRLVDTNENTELTAQYLDITVDTVGSKLDSLIEFLGGAGTDQVILSEETIDKFKEPIVEKITSLVDFMQGNSLDELEERREERANQRMLAAAVDQLIDQQDELLEKAEKNNELQEEQNKGSGDGFGLGKLTLGIAIAIGTFKGIVEGYVKTTKALLVAFKNLSAALFKPIQKLFSSVVSLLRNRFASIDKVFKTFQSIGRGIVETFRKFAKSVKTIMSVGGAIGRASLMAPINMFFAAANKVRSVFSTAGGALSKLGASIAKPFTSIISMFRDAVNMIMKPIKATASATGRIGKLFASVTGVLARMGTVIASVARLAGPIGVIINLAIAAFGTITGAIKGFKEGGILGALKGAISGFFKALVGVPLDFIKGAVAWILDLFGLDRVAEALRSFSFSDIIESIVAAPFKIFEFIKDWIVDKVKGLGSIVASLIPGPIKKLLGIDGSEQEEEGPRTREDVQSELAEAREDKEGRFGFGAEGRREEDQKRIDALEKELAMLDYAEGPNAVELEKMERDRKKRQTEQARKEAGYTESDQQLDQSDASRESTRSLEKPSQGTSTGVALDTPSQPGAALMSGAQPEIDEGEERTRGRERRGRRSEVEKPSQGTSTGAALDTPSQPGTALMSGAQLEVAGRERSAIETERERDRRAERESSLNVMNSTTNNISSSSATVYRQNPSPVRRPNSADQMFYVSP